jgi:hypothetical protein
MDFQFLAAIFFNTNLNLTLQNLPAREGFFWKKNKFKEKSKKKLKM